MCRSRGGVIIFGRAHEPRSRPIVEQLFSRLERGALRRIPGGFEPAKSLNESRRRISKVPGNEHYFNLGAFEELLDVIIANYNATPHPALGSLSPLQFLRTQPCSAFAFSPDVAEQDAADLCTVLVPLVAWQQAPGCDAPRQLQICQIPWTRPGWALGADRQDGARSRQSQ